MGDNLSGGTRSGGKKISSYSLSVGSSNHVNYGEETLLAGELEPTHG